MWRHPSKGGLRIETTCYKDGGGVEKSWNSCDVIYGWPPKYNTTTDGSKKLGSFAIKKYIEWLHSPEYEDLEDSCSLKVKGMWTFIIFICGIWGCTVCTDPPNTSSSPFSRNTIMFLKKTHKINIESSRIINYQHNISSMPHF